MGRLLLIVFLILAVVAIAAYPAVLWFQSAATTLQWTAAVTVLGTATPISVVAVNPHGIRTFQAILEQGGKTYQLLEQRQNPIRWSLWRPSVNPATFTFEAGTARAAGLKDGQARLRVVAVSNDLRARHDELAVNVEVNTRPPSLQVDAAHHTLTLGGSHAVTFTAAGYWTEAGVRVGPYTFRSFPLPGGSSPNRRICFFGFPWDTREGEVPFVYVRNPAGAEASERLQHTLKRREFRARQLQLDDRFLHKAVRELDPAGTGDLVHRFVRINNDMRKANNTTLAELRHRTAPQILWAGAFRQQGNTAVEAQFCDLRRYFYQGQSIDEQVHLGYDLASLAKSPVAAANRGTVVFAGRLGIYGQAVVLDHGLGVQSLYAHLSEIGVKEKQEVKQGETLGRSGDTGLAGGDHLHFGMQLDGVAVNPLEWLDPKWIENLRAVIEVRGL